MKNEQSKLNSAGGQVPSASISGGSGVANSSVVKARKEYALNEKELADQASLVKKKRTKHGQEKGCLFLKRCLT